jgi:hypothetical protein
VPRAESRMWLALLQEFADRCSAAVLLLVGSQAFAVTCWCGRHDLDAKAAVAAPARATCLLSTSLPPADGLNLRQDRSHA